MLIEKQHGKLKVLTLSGDPISYSGVGNQMRYLIEGLLATGRYQFLSLGSSLEPASYTPIATEKWGYDWVIQPIHDYGDETIMRHFLKQEQPDALLLLSDPRSHLWLFDVLNEVQIPKLYWLVWDAKPAPVFGKHWFDACDFLGCISKLTYEVMCEMGLDAKAQYIPHAVDTAVFHPAPALSGTFTVLFVSRNERRKHPMDTMRLFKAFMDRYDLNDQCRLIMHTHPSDWCGTNLPLVAEMLKLRHDQVIFSDGKLLPEGMAALYNLADVTICLSSSEGFGLSCLESLSCGTPVIVNGVGGLQEQPIDDQGNVFGVVIKPATQTLIGDQDVQYIFDCKASDEDVVVALKTLYDMGYHQRKLLGARGSEWVGKAYSMTNMIRRWDEALTRCQPVKQPVASAA